MTMKVAYNACYGGFGLSNKATQEFAKRKGIILFWYRSVERNPTIYYRLEGVPDDSGCDINAFTTDLGEVAQTYPEDTYYYPTYDRADEDLIAVIEELGAAANDSYAELAIAEIPDGAEYEITEYDGYEGVEPPRTVW